MSDIIYDNLIRRDDVPPTCVFHRTGRENTRDILQNGFRLRNKTQFDETDEEFFEAVLDTEGLDFPVDRLESHFFYSNASRWEGDLSNQYLIAVDIRAISNPIVVADMSAYDSVISSAPLDTHRAVNGPFEDDEIQAVQNYLDTATEVLSAQALGYAVHGLETPEIIIEGDIDTSAIVGVVEHEM